MINKSNLTLWLLKGLNENTLRRKLILWRLEKEINKMDDGKSKWKSKTVWAAIITVVVSGIEPISKALGYPIVVPSWVIEVLIGLGLYGIRDAIGKNSAIK